MTGDMVGTLRYMSPEQALANHGVVDHRTDVYSLGATLYELCTGRPAVAGKNRQEILKGLADDGPPPRATAAPAELDTIVQKAMAKDLADRYGTARELADDLGRHLEGKPIRAKRPTPAQRLWKWGQRHRQLVWATSFFLAAAVIGLAVSVFLIWQEKERTREALMEALANHRRAEAQRQRAETNFREAYWTLEDLLIAFDTEGDAHSISVAELKQWQTGAALRFLAPFCEDESDEPDRRLQKGAAYVHTGRVYQVLGQREKAQEAFRRAIAVFGRLVQDFPEESTFSREMAIALSILATDLFLAGNIAEANSHYRQALGILREAVQKHPADVEARLKLAHFQCVWLDSNLHDPPAALKMAQLAVKDAPDDPCGLMILAIAQCRMEQWRAAIGTFDNAFRKSRSFNRNCETTQGLFFLAMAQTRCGLHQEATESYQKAVRRMADSPVRRGHALTRATRAEAATALGIAEPSKLKQP